MILVDPKRVEMGQYNRLPHLLTQVVTNPKKAANALAGRCRRWSAATTCWPRSASATSPATTPPSTAASWPTARGGSDREGPTYARLPFILVVVDELNDLMMVAARDVEDSICRIAQMARAVGIHLVIATQRPSVNVITGVIKANIPARWPSRCRSLADSRVILDQPGAERLIGQGDMLLLGPASSIPQRIQGSWVTEEEVRKVVGHWRRQAPEVAYDEEVQGTTTATAGGCGRARRPLGDDDDDDLLAQAMELVVRSQLGSTSMLQRKLRVGFARAGRLMDLLEQRGVVGPSEGSKAAQREAPPTGAASGARGRPPPPAPARGPPGPPGGGRGGPAGARGRGGGGRAGAGGARRGGGGAGAASRAGAGAETGGGGAGGRRPRPRRPPWPRPPTGRPPARPRPPRAPAPRPGPPSPPAGAGAGPAARPAPRHRGHRGGLAADQRGWCSGEPAPASPSGCRCCSCGPPGRPAPRCSPTRSARTWAGTPCSPQPCWRGPCCSATSGCSRWRSQRSPSPRSSTWRW